MENEQKKSSQFLKKYFLIQKKQERKRFIKYF